MIKITYYDFSNITYASFFLQGFLGLHERGVLEFKVSKRIPDELADMEFPTWITYRKPATTMVFRYEESGSDFLFCIDANDHNGLDPDLADSYPGYHMALIERVKFYFKINYNEEVFAVRPAVSPYAAKIIPTPVVFPLRLSKTRPFLPKITPFNGQRFPLGAARRRLRHMRELLPLDEYRRLRLLPRDIDVLFVTTIYIKEDHEEINAWRLALLEALSANPKLKTLIGFISHKDNIPKPFARFQVQPMPFDTYMSKLARSKVGLYTRGTFGALSFKFGQYFALGKPIVGEPLLNNRQNLYAYPEFKEQFRYTDPIELADRLAELVADPAKLQALGDTNTETFEKHFTPEAVLDNIMAYLTRKRHVDVVHSET